MEKEAAKHSNQEVLEYWNRDDVESMYDKHLLNAEIRLIQSRIPANSKILDAGCGEGEGTLAYSRLPGALVHAVDFSENRLRKAAERLKGASNVVLKQVDFLKEYRLDYDYNIIVSQRFLINLMEWDLQKKVLRGLMAMLRPGGRLLMIEGSRQGVDELNAFRACWGLEPIPVKWHNLFFDNQALVGFMHGEGYKLVEQDGLGVYFLLTRGVRPVLEKDLRWDCDFNRAAAAPEMERILQLGPRFSRLTLWVFKK